MYIVLEQFVMIWPDANRQKASCSSYGIRGWELAVHIAIHTHVGTEKSVPLSCSIRVA